MTALVGVASGSRESQRLTGFGATKKDWYAHHTPDRSGKFEPGCCFLPRNKDGHDRYAAVTFVNGRVFSFDMLFSPPVTPAEAKFWIKREAPPDGKVVFDVRKPTCEQIQYRSRLLAKAFKEKVGVMMAELSTQGGAATYSARSVDDIIFLPSAAPAPRRPPARPSRSARRTPP